MTILIHGTGVMSSLTSSMAQDEGHTVFMADEFTTEKGDVIIDFSHFSRLENMLSYAALYRIPSVIATTGFGQDIGAIIDKTSLDIPLFLASNMSLGVNLLHEVLQKLVPVLAPICDIEIIEKHHNKKLDSPSGTANSLAETVIKSSPKPLVPKYGRSGNAKRLPEELGMHSLRGGTVVGEHSIIFYGEDEIIELRHTALSKRIFSKGALEAAKFLIGKEAGLYGMEDLLNR